MSVGGERTRCPPTYSSSKKDKREAVVVDGRGGAVLEGFNGGSEDEPSSSTDEIIYPVVWIAGEVV